MTILLFACYVGLCILVGKISQGKKVLGFNRHIGFWSGFYLSFIFTPFLVFFVLLCLPDRKQGKKA